MNPIQKQLLGLGAVVMLAMLIFPPWTRITHHIVRGSDRSTMQTETQGFAGYSLLFEPPQTRSSLYSPQMLMPGDYYENVEIDFDLFLLQWLTATFLTAAGLLYFKGSDKKSLQECWSSVITPAKPSPASNPPKATPPDSPISETQVHFEPVEIVKAKADGGDAHAQGVLGLMYEQGQGVTQDYVEAVKWLRKAAEQGEVIIQSILGRKYEIGQGVTQDFVEAAKWYRRAAEHGDKFAQMRLAEMQVPTDPGSKKTSETTPRNQLSPWKRALTPAGSAFGIGVVAGIASATSVRMDVPPSGKLLFDGFMAVVAGLLLAVPTYLIAGLYFAAKGEQDTHK